MDTFDKRGESFENRFVHEQELRFRAEARRNKLLGAWAAAKLGKIGGDAQAYADALVATGALQGTSEAVFAKVKKDFAGAGVAQSDHQIRRTMDELLEAATAEVKAGE